MTILGIQKADTEGFIEVGQPLIIGQVGIGSLLSGLAPPT